MKRNNSLERRVFRIETILWILLGSNMLKLGGDFIPLVAAVFNG